MNRHILQTVDCRNSAYTVKLNHMYRHILYENLLLTALPWYFQTLLWLIYRLLNIPYKLTIFLQIIYDNKKILKQ